jgi:hypothetical protein
MAPGTQRAIDIVGSTTGCDVGGTPFASLRRESLRHKVCEHVFDEIVGKNSALRLSRTRIMVYRFASRPALPFRLQLVRREADKIPAIITPRRRRLRIKLSG